MKRFEVGKKYRIPENCWNYKGTFVLLSREAESIEIKYGRSETRTITFKRWPALVNGKKTWVDLAEDKELDCESFHEISGTTGEWKRHTCRIHLQG